MAANEPTPGPSNAKKCRKSDQYTDHELLRVLEDSDVEFREDEPDEGDWHLETAETDHSDDSVEAELSSMFRDSSESDDTGDDDEEIADDKEPALAEMTGGEVSSISGNVDDRPQNTLEAFPPLLRKDTVDNPAGKSSITTNKRRRTCDGSSTDEEDINLSLKVVGDIQKTVLETVSDNIVSIDSNSESSTSLDRSNMLASPEQVEVTSESHSVALDAPVDGNALLLVTPQPRAAVPVRQSMQTDSLADATESKHDEVASDCQQQATSQPKSQDEEAEFYNNNTQTVNESVHRSDGALEECLQTDSAPPLADEMVAHDCPSDPPTPLSVENCSGGGRSRHSVKASVNANRKKSKKKGSNANRDGGLQSDSQEVSGMEWHEMID
ncbi:dentin sialophosphoprotein-like [Schistocerca piceifrons]|uniref:dentin sialophosphoprotein-like n=1 Tax=Schistocerca piceifrons TaxID=274613 RepID=UPI001F5E700A|nr:dentin sialophosphoprotein-like [Schistocerca piceifrons]